MSPQARLREEMAGLARAHLASSTGAPPAPLGPRLRRLERGLAATYRRLAGRRYAPGELPVAVEWLRDNDHVIQDALEQVRLSLPRGYYARLQAPGRGPDAGRPRAESLARELLDRLEAPLDIDALAELLDDYQAVAPLAIGELWALPALLRLAVLERLAPAAAAAVAQPGVAPPPAGKRGAAGDGAPPAGAAAPSWGDEPAAPAAPIAAAVRTLRALAAADWRAWFERCSVLERALRDDPSGDYARMSFATRDRYRRTVESLARGSRTHDELAVARAALALASAAAASSAGAAGPGEPGAGATVAPRAAHVGCHLIAEGRGGLEAAIGYLPPPRLRLGRALEPRAFVLYATCVALAGGAALALALAWLAALGVHAAIVAAIGLLAIVPAWSLGASAVDWLITLVVPPRALPRMDPDDGVPPESRTLAVMPVILRGVPDVAPLLERLEVNYLGNRDANLGFMLLTDLADAGERHLPGDDAIVDALSQGVRELNARYGGDRSTEGGDRRGAASDPPFHLLHRERRWNPVERLWMGWERKRGKLEEFNELLTGRGGASFSVRVDAPTDLASVRYVLTLDADTRLPPGAARELVAAFRHPLNRPVLDPHGDELRAGYTVLQPRVEADAATMLETAFARVMTGESGVDLYAQTVSNVHHDLFGRAIFGGKGLYEVDAFERRLRGRVPENRLLSHDLFEGVHGRVGLASDVVLFEQVPANAVQHALRLHRWVRGDWQLLPWLVARRPLGRHGRLAHGLRPLDRWQVADNLRRSLYLPSLLGLLAGAWLALPGPAALATTLGVLALLGLPVALTALAAVRRGAAGQALRPVVETAAHDARLESARWAVTVALLPYLALVTSDAIGRALYRVYVSRRGLLQWTTAAQSARTLGTSLTLRAALRHMWGAVALALALAALLAILAPASLPAALPLLAAWALSPAIAAWTSHERVRRREPLTEPQRRTLRLIARRTWHFFAELVGPRDHWLPPDHLQEDPGPMTARRTSPTNVGMMLTSTVAAYDLGFIEARELAARVLHTLDTLDRLERHRGHWLNWYGTHDLAPLEPRYVSTVDSGNLAAALLVVARGLDDARHEGVPYPARARGLADTVAVLGDVVARLRPRLDDRAARRALAPARATLSALEDELRAVANRPFTARRDAVAHAERELRRVAERLVAALEAAPAGVPYLAVRELRAWIDQALGEAAATRAEIDAAVPWLDLLDDLPTAYRQADGALDETLPHLTAALAEPFDLASAPELAARCRSLVAELEQQLEALPPAADAAAAADAARRWNAALLATLDDAQERGRRLAADLEEAAARCRTAADAMDFRFLYDPVRALFHLGYHVSAGEYDANHYDLLASEARTASLLAIAKGDAPVEHWLHLGRPLARVRGARVLLSWSATMFEYLMPRLFLRHPERTLMHESCHAMLEQQIAFARRHGVPWGISESAFAELGIQGDYQYRAFGVPGVGLKADLGERLVVAPYASLLALPLRPREAMGNVTRLIELGALGRYGMIDAVDFGDTASHAAASGPTAGTDGDPLTPSRPHLVRTYMAHHQGMILVAATNQLLKDRMVERLHAEPQVTSVELLLHERIPIHVPPPKRWRHPEAAAAEPGAPAPGEAPAWTVDPRGGIDHALPLSNGANAVLARAAGGGGSHWGGAALTRDQPFDSGGARGTTVYLRDLDDGDTWSTTLDPTGGDPADCRVTFEPHRVRYRRQRGDLVTRDEWTVADRDALELRRVSVTNDGDRPRRLALASYAEVVLTGAAEDARHPAFAKLFVEAESRDGLSTLLFRRRQRAPHERTPVWAQRLLLEPGSRATRTACTDRRAFVGRGGSLRAPSAPTLAPDGPPPMEGATLDPIASLGCVLEVAPGATVHAVFVGAAGWSGEAVLAALRRCDTPARAERLVERAAAAAATELRGLGVNSDELPALADLLALAIAPREALRAGLVEAGPLLPVLWSLGVSGDLPIVLLRVADEASLPFVLQVLRGHAWWRGRQVGIDLLLLDELSRGYDTPLRDRLERAVHEVARRGRTQGPGRAVVLPVERVGGDLPTLLAAAAVVLDADGAPLHEQLARAATRPAPLPAFVPVPGPLQPSAKIASLAPPEAERTASPPRRTFGGFGGYAGDLVDVGEGEAADVVLHLDSGRPTPAPWINVIANEHFGFLVSERGSGTTWGPNSGERRLTPWANDPVRDPAGEALYLRDEETGEVWSPTPAPASAADAPGGGGAYRVRHGAGFTTFTHHGHGLEQTLTLFVDPDEPVKLMTLRLRDRWDRPRRLTVTGYVEWLLGVLRSRQAPFVVPDYDADTGTLLARTLLGPMADTGVAFLTSSRPPHGLTTDRREFLGPDLDPADPAGLRRVGLSGTVRPGVDPCAALQVHVDLEPGGETELHFVLGLGDDRAAALALARRFRDPAEATASLARVRDGWRERLGRIVVRTPDSALDHALNRWLPYQALACRLWGRSALYQSSGAFGFRDQLQDAANLAPLEPALARAQLLRAAARQFEEGDVLHWWHPDTGAGVRTRCSDDLLWLPWACARYLERTGDAAVLAERVPYLHAPPLAAGEVERFDTYRPGDRDGTLLDHCLRALERGDTRGPHGLPLIGGGDWNDGMNRLGLEGRGESVWLGWFLCTVLEDGARLCERGAGADAAGGASKTEREGLIFGGGILDIIDESKGYLRPDEYKPSSDDIYVSSSQI
ncbi:MAG: glucoamylase family protein, partial [Trueperaceae bacterium]